MFMQTIAAAFTATFVGLHSAGGQSSSVQSPPSAHIVQMVNLVTTVDKTVDTKKARAGDPFTARVATAGKLDDSTDVPAGSILEGHVDSVTPSENKGDSVLTVTIDKLAIKNGKEVPVKATITRVDSTSPDSGDDKGYSEPSAYRVTSIPSTKPASMQDPNAPKMPRAVPDLTLKSSPHDATSGTFTYAKKNLRLNSSFQLQVSVAAAPPGVRIQ